MASSIVLVLTTLPADADAMTFGRRLVEERLAACVSVVGSLHSVYRWKGTIEDATEQQLLIKTEASVLDALKQRLGSLHPYEMPELLVLPVTDGGAEYLAWVRHSIAG